LPSTIQWIAAAVDAMVYGRIYSRLAHSSERI